MMKKLLILTLILGLASVANAALVLSFNGDTSVSVTAVAPSDYFTVDVYQTEDTSDEFWVLISGDGSYTGHGTLYIPPAPTGMVADDGGYGAAWTHAYMPTPATDGQIGKWWEIEIHCDGPGDVVVDLYDSSGYVIIDTLTIIQPEPMSVALLGLGGLFLRRRKR